MCVSKLKLADYSTLQSSQFSETASCDQVNTELSQHCLANALQVWRKINKKAVLYYTPLKNVTLNVMLMYNGTDCHRLTNYQRF